MKNAFIIHGFNGDTTNTFGPALKDFLEREGITIWKRMKRYLIW